MATAGDFWHKIVDSIKYRFDLSEDQNFAHDVVADIDKTIVFKGTNLWALIFSIMVASVGLNVNSTAVVIGAMLISPLMGPIMGLGLGIGIYDFEMIKRSMKNLGIMVFVSLVTSAIYFAISPIKEENSELFGRTLPTIFDVLIAFFGGLAGIVAGTRKEKGNAVAGVAIATALMPPICTAGWGLATLQFSKFAGAMYLFTINTVMISVSTYLVVRLLHFPIKEFLSAEAEARVRKYVGITVLITIIPSIFLAYNIIRKAFVEQRVTNFVKNECAKLSNTDLVKNEFNFAKKKLDLYFMGDILSSEDSLEIMKELEQYELEGIELEIHQGRKAVESKFDVAEVKTGIIEDLYERNQEAISSMEGKIELLENELSEYKEYDKNSDAIVKEFQALYPNVQSFSVNQNRLFDLKKKENRTLPLAYVEYKGRLYKSEKKKIENWLQVRLQADTVVVIFK